MAVLMTDRMLRAAEGSGERAIKPFQGEARFEIQQVFESGRLPNVVVTM